jgi:hypothetical protein
VSPAPPRLLPGLHVVRRDGTHVQVGVDAPHRVILRADRPCLDLLELLRHGAPTGDLGDAEQRVVLELAAAGLLVDDKPAAAVPRQVAVHDHTPGMVGTGRGPDGSVPLGRRLERLLDAAGVSVGGGGQAELVVLCSSAPLPRAVVDPLAAEGVAHLVVCGTGAPGSLRVGPLVEPGSTACLRCVDAAEAVADPRRPLIIEQLATRQAAPIDPLTVDLGLAWAARDVVAHLAGRTPATWSATVEAQASPPVVRSWQRHPHCGCCWDELPY